MNGSVLVDLLLAAIGIGALVNGYRAGLLRTAAGLAGLVAGGVAAFFMVPWLTAQVTQPEWRIPAAIGAIVLLLGVGTALGGAIGRLLRRGAKRIRLGWLDRLTGALGNLVVAILIAVLVATTVQGLGVPTLSPAIAGSRIVAAVERLTPKPVQSFLAQARDTALDGAAPWVARVLNEPVDVAAPPAASETAAVQRALGSVVRVSGAAFQCGTSLSGSGFVVAPDRIVTNAHVVAGVDRPVVEAPNGAAVSGRVVAYDPEHDLAVIAVNGFDVPALPVAPVPAPATTGWIAGYPFGGPLTVGTAAVIGTAPADMTIEGRRSVREVTSLAGTVNHGNSGGPVLGADGDVIGVVFAKSETNANLGYAVPTPVLDPLAQKAPALTAPVGTGSCVAP